MKIYAGTSGYSYAEWKGNFYPEKISPAEMLRFYSGRLSAVEINNTFYHMPQEHVLASWAEQVPDDFVFAIKSPQIITHIKRLRDVGTETEYLFNTLPVLGKKLGPVLFQFPGSFRADRDALKEFLTLLPSDASCAFEFRNRSWFEADILDLLRKRGCSLCVADTDEKPADEIIGTAQWGYLRLRRPDYTDLDLSEWTDKILSQQWKTAFVFFKHEGGAGGAELAMRFRQLAEKRTVRHQDGTRSLRPSVS